MLLLCDRCQASTPPHLSPTLLTKGQPRDLMTDATTPQSFTSPLAQRLADDLLERFQRYVRIETTSRRDREQLTEHAGPARARDAAGERAARARARRTRRSTSDGYVTATLEGSGPTIGLVAHLDTSPDAPGAGVAPLVHRGYGGEVIDLPRGGTRLDPGTMPALSAKLGHDIVSSSGDTLLGADDKAGVAIIMAALRAAEPLTPSSRGAACASASPPTRRSVRGRRCSTSRASVPAAPTRSTARRSASSRTRASARGRR